MGVNVQRIRRGKVSSRRLSRYIVAQYCGGQSGLVRLSQSRGELPFARMRQALLHTLRGLPERYQAAQPLLDLAHEEFERLFRQLFWLVFRQAWEDLATTSQCQVYGVDLVWCCNRLERL